MHKYTLKNTNLIVFIISISILLGVSIYFETELNQLPKYFDLVVFAIFYVCSALISYKLTTIKLLIKIDDVGISIIKSSGIFPYRSKNFLFSEVKEYTLSDDLNYYHFKIRLKNNSTIRILKFADAKDDFQKFTNKFIKTINSLNDEKKTEIPRILNLYETRGGIIIAGLLVLITL